MLASKAVCVTPLRTFVRTPLQRTFAHTCTNTGALEMPSGPVRRITERQTQPRGSGRRTRRVRKEFRKGVRRVVRKDAHTRVRDLHV